MTTKTFVLRHSSKRMGKEERRQKQQKARSWKADGQVINNTVAPRKLNPEPAVEKQNNPTYNGESLKVQELVPSSTFEVGANR